MALSERARICYDLPVDAGTFPAHLYTDTEGTLSRSPRINPGKPREGFGIRNVGTRHSDQQPLSRTLCQALSLDCLFEAFTERLSLEPMNVSTIGPSAPLRNGLDMPTM